MKIITAKEVADLLKLTKSTVYALAAEGKLSGFRIGNSWRFDMDEIMHQIKESQGLAAHKGKGEQTTRKEEEDGGDA